MSSYIAIHETSQRKMKNPKMVQVVAFILFWGLTCLSSEKSVEVISILQCILPSN